MRLPLGPPGPAIGASLRGRGRLGIAIGGGLRPTRWARVRSHTHGRACCHFHHCTGPNHPTGAYRNAHCAAGIAYGCPGSDTNPDANTRPDTNAVAYAHPDTFPHP